MADLGQEAVDTCGTVLSEGDCYSQEKVDGGC